MTDAADRKALIDELKAKSPHTHTLRFRQRFLPFPVARVPNPRLLYRMRNGRTQVEQLLYIQEHGLAPDFFEHGEENDEAQGAQHAILLRMAKDPTASIYGELERVAEQKEPLVSTAYGVILNGNRRLAAMRELLAQDARSYESFAHVDVMVLPEDAREEDLELIEVELQLAPETKQEYGWIERRLKLRRHTEELRIPRNLIQYYYGFPREEDINVELQQLRLAEEYLETYLNKPRAYLEVAKSEQLFRDLQKALAGKSGQEADVRRLIGFALAREARTRGVRVYEFNRAFGRDFERVAIATADGFGIPVTTREPERHLNGEEDPLDGLGGSNSRDWSELIVRLGDPAESACSAHLITEAVRSVRDEDRDESARLDALKSVQQANTLLNGLNLATADPGTYSRIRAQLESIERTAATLRDRLNELEQAARPATQ